MGDRSLGARVLTPGEPRSPGAPRYLAVAVAGVFAALGLAAAVTPGTVIASSRYLVSPVGIYAASALRTGLGVALLLVARGSRAPAILRLMAVALLIAGVTMPLLGVDNAKARIEWEAEHILFLRMEGVLFAWAGLVVYSLPGRSTVRMTWSGRRLRRADSQQATGPRGRFIDALARRSGEDRGGHPVDGSQQDAENS